jgi:hypothetical protein
MTKLWNPDEIALLKEIYPKGTKESIKINFPDRTWAAIRAKAKRFGLKIGQKTHGQDRRTQGKLQFIVNNYGKLTQNQMMKELNETDSWLTRQITKLLKMGIINPEIKRIHKLGLPGF